MVLKKMEIKKFNELNENNMPEGIGNMDVIRDIVKILRDNGYTVSLRISERKIAISNEPGKYTWLSY